MDSVHMVGRATFANGEVILYYDADSFLDCIREELPYFSTSGFHYEVLTDDPAIRKAADDIFLDFFGEENQRGLDNYIQDRRWKEYDMNINHEMVESLRKQYPPGTRIRLDNMDDPYAPVPAGMTGTVESIDDAGQFHMRWDNGRTLALIPGVDSFTVLPPQLSVMKLYMPLTADLYARDEWGDMPEEPELLSGRDLLPYEDNIRSALVKYRMPEELTRGLMNWYNKTDTVNNKVRSVTFGAELRGEQLWGVAECQLWHELSAAELTTLKEFITGQASDGWGEGFEQREIAVDGGSELYVHLWQDHDWSIQTEQERFCPHLDKLPEMCFTLLPGTGQLICVKRGESGYYPSDWSTDDPHENRLIADEQNRKLGVTPAQEEAMKIGSMCGWDVPGADPDNCEDIVQRRGGMELG